MGLSTPCKSNVKCQSGVALIISYPSSLHCIALRVIDPPNPQSLTIPLPRLFVILFITDILHSFRHHCALSLVLDIPTYLSYHTVARTEGATAHVTLCYVSDSTKPLRHAVSYIASFTHKNLPLELPIPAVCTTKP